MKTTANQQLIEIDAEIEIGAVVTTDQLPVVADPYGAADTETIAINVDETIVKCDALI